MNLEKPSVSPGVPFRKHLVTRRSQIAAAAVAQLGFFVAGNAAASDGEPVLGPILTAQAQSSIPTEDPGGAPAEETSLSRSMRFEAGMESLRIETGWLRDERDGEASDSHHLRADGYVRGDLGDAWEVLISARVDGYYEQSTPSLSDVETDYGPTYIRYNGTDTVITLGAQRIVWGRTFELSPNDRLNVEDVSRFVLYDASWRRRAMPSLRIERFFGSFQLDLVWAPEFRSAELPEPESIWFPVDRRNGQIISIESTPIVQELVRQGKFDESDPTEGAAGFRFSGSGARADYALTVQRAPHSLPYYELDATVRGLLLQGTDVAGAVAATERTFTEVHPSSWFIGSDVAIDALSATWRLDFAYVSDIPVTSTAYEYTTERGLDWATEVEFFPGSGNTRVNLQLAGRELLDSPSVLDRGEFFAFRGQTETRFSRDRWKAGIRFSFGLDRRDVYLNPEIAYAGKEPYELYLSYHHFSGEPRTAGHFHQDHDVVTLGWRARY